MTFQKKKSKILLYLQKHGEWRSALTAITETWFRKNYNLTCKFATKSFSEILTKSLPVKGKVLLYLAAGNEQLPYMVHTCIKVS